MKYNRVRTSLSEPARIIAGVLAESRGMTIQEVVDTAVVAMLYTLNSLVIDYSTIASRTLPFVHNKDYASVDDLILSIIAEKQHDVID